MVVTPPVAGGELRARPINTQQVLMQLAQFGRHEIVPTRGVLGVQPQHPVPDMVVDAGQGGGAGLSGGSELCGWAKIRSTFTGSSRMSM